MKRGDIITVKNVVSNGHDEQPAVVTNVWGESDVTGEAVVNAKVLPDCGEPRDATSVTVYRDRTAAEAFLETCENVRPIVGFVE